MAAIRWIEQDWTLVPTLADNPWATHAKTPGSLGSMAGQPAQWGISFFRADFDLW